MTPRSIWLLALGALLAANCRRDTTTRPSTIVGSASVRTERVTTSSTSGGLTFVGPERGFAGGGDDHLFAAALDASGRLIAAGRSRDPSGRDHALLLILDGGGAARPFSEGRALVVEVESPNPGPADARTFFDVAIDPRGRIVAVGQSGPPGGSKAFIARFTPEGQLDPSFGDLAGRGPARKGFAVGMGDEFLDDAFVPVPPEDLTPDERFTAVAFDTRGRIITAGMTGDRSGGVKDEFSGCGRFPFEPCPARLLRALVARWTEAGVLDTSFHKTGYSLGRTAKSSWSGGGRELVFDVVTLPDDSVLAVGAATPSGEQRVPLMLKLTAAGDLSETFAGGRGFVLGPPRSRAGGAREELMSVAVDPTGKLVVAGLSWDDAGRGHTLVARSLGTGQPDTTFAEAGFALDERAAPTDAPVALALDDHEPIVARGARLAAASASGSWDSAFAERTARTASIAVSRVLVQPSTRHILAVGAANGRAVVLRTER